VCRVLPFRAEPPRPPPLPFAVFPKPSAFPPLFHGVHVGVFKRPTPLNFFFLYGSGAPGAWSSRDDLLSPPGPAHCGPLRFLRAVGVFLFFVFAKRRPGTTPLSFFFFFFILEDFWTCPLYYSLRPLILVATVFSLNPGSVLRACGDPLNGVFPRAGRRSSAGFLLFF